MRGGSREVPYLSKKKRGKWGKPGAIKRVQIKPGKNALKRRPVERDLLIKKKKLGTSSTFGHRPTRSTERQVRWTGKILSTGENRGEVHVRLRETGLAQKREKSGWEEPRSGESTAAGKQKGVLKAVDWNLDSPRRWGGEQ